MTQLRKFRDAISNYFDTLMHGIGKGDGFTDIDAVTHDSRTDRFLFQEFKEAGEALDKGQRILLYWLAKRPRMSAWLCMKQSDGRIRWGHEWREDEARGEPVVATRLITEGQYRALVDQWWTNEPLSIVPDEPSPLSEEDNQAVGREAFGLTYRDGQAVTDATH